MEAPGNLSRADGIQPYSNVLASSLDLWSVPNLDISAEDTYVAEFSPNVPVGDGSSDIHFSCGSSTDFTDLSRSNILIETHLEMADGTDLIDFTADESVGFDQLPVACMFR